MHCALVGVSGMPCLRVVLSDRWQPTPLPPRRVCCPALSVNGADSPVLVHVSFDTTYVGGSDCDTTWSTCNTTVTSPACSQLLATLAVGSAVLCSIDPQYLTVSSDGTALDFAYAVRKQMRHTGGGCRRDCTHCRFMTAILFEHECPFVGTRMVVWGSRFCGVCHSHSDTFSLRWRVSELLHCVCHCQPD